MQAGTVVIDKAQASISSQGLEPQRQAVSLPLHWNIFKPDNNAVAALSMHFTAPLDPGRDPWAVLVPRLGNAWRLEVNGNLLREAGELDRHHDSWAAKKPVWVSIPAALLREDNELKITLRLDRGRRAGLSQVMVGPAELLRPEWDLQEWVRVTLPQAATVLSLLVAAFCMLLWWQQRDRLYAAAACGELAWGLRLMDTWLEASPLPWLWWSAVVLGLFWVWTAATYLLVREVWEGQRPRAEGIGAVLLLAAAPLLYGLAIWQQSAGWVVAWMATSLSLWVLLTLRLAWEAARDPQLPKWAMVVALTACLVAITRDIYAGRLNTLLYDESAWSKYAAVTMALSVLLMVGMRFKRARLDLVALNQSIQRRIEDRERELSVQHARLNVLEREKATAAERTRILRDMHDGAGAHLIAAIHQIESGDASSAELLATLGESLDQLRLSVDAMNLPDGDIGGLLASLRFRLERRIQRAGLRLRWSADEIPTVARFTGTDMRHVQFILIEAISNAIQHARATELSIGASHGDGQIHLEVRDNGVGPSERSGNGMRTMRERAALIGATLQLEAAAPGLRLRLNLPVAAPSAEL